MIDFWTRYFFLEIQGSRFFLENYRELLLWTTTVNLYREPVYREPVYREPAYREGLMWSFVVNLCCNITIDFTVNKIVQKASWSIGGQNDKVLKET